MVYFSVNDMLGRNKHGTHRELGLGEFPLSPEEVGFHVGIHECFKEEEIISMVGHTFDYPPEEHDFATGFTELAEREDYQIGFPRGYGAGLHVAMSCAIAEGMKEVMREMREEA